MYCFFIKNEEIVLLIDAFNYKSLSGVVNNITTICCDNNITNYMLCHVQKQQYYNCFSYRFIFINFFLFNHVRKIIFHWLSIFCYLIKIFRTFLIYCLCTTKCVNGINFSNFEQGVLLKDNNQVTKARVKNDQNWNLKLLLLSIACFSPKTRYIYTFLSAELEFTSVVIILNSLVH